MGANRPLLVTVIGVIYVLFGILLLLSGAVLAFSGEALDLGVEELSSLSGSTAAVIGIVQIIVGAGFLRGWGLWWYLGVIITVIMLIMSIASILAIGFAAVVPTLVSLIVLWYLFRDNVKSFFLD